MQYPTFPGVQVVGMHFRPNGKAIVESLLAPASFDLEREPGNSYDPYAIKVMYDGEHIGYVERQQAMFIAPWMDQGVEYACIATEFREHNRNLYPIVTIEPADA
jgi:hypothetical protein